MRFVVVLIAVVVAVARTEVIERGNASDDVRYFLHTRSIANRRLYNSYGLRLNTEYDSSLKTYFLIHGWNGGDYEDSWAEDIGQALLKHENCNIIYVQWKEWANDANYFNARRKCSQVGQELATFIAELEKAFKASRSNMHLIGHSLGGQVAGFAGAQLQSPKLARITGLDTSGIGFRCLTDKNDCLDPSDAEFVDEIHTLISGLPKGHADFYPIPKNIFRVLIETQLYKAHFLGADYFVKSLEAGQCAFKATECSSYDSYKEGGCKMNDANSLGFYAQKPKGSPPNKYYLSIDMDKPC